MSLLYLMMVLSSKLGLNDILFLFPSEKLPQNSTLQPHNTELAWLIKGKMDLSNLLCQASCQNSKTVFDKYNTLVYKVLQHILMIPGWAKLIYCFIWYFFDLWNFANLVGEGSFSRQLPIQWYLPASKVTMFHFKFTGIDKMTIHLPSRQRTSLSFLLRSLQRKN